MCVLAMLPTLAAAGDPPQTDQGAALLAPFKQQLQQALQQGMASGVVQAIDTCHTEAPRIAAGQQDAEVRMGRSSHRLRNPANAPADWMQGAINHYLESPQHRQPVVVRLDGGRVGYAEPILLQPLCLACHGDNLAAEVQQRLRQLYPEDQATGFRPGELRGIFWVEFVPQ